MPIKRDLSNLPKPEQAEGLVPDKGVRFGASMARAAAAKPSKSHAFVTPFRYSDAAKCARYLSYAVAGTEREPIDLAGHNTMHAGTVIHEEMQREWFFEFGKAMQFEVPSHVGMLTSGSCDGLLTEADGTKTVVELKTVGGFKFKLAVGERGMAQGPSAAYIVQLALNVVGHDADRGVLVMVTSEAISKGIAERKEFADEQRFAAEWTFERSQLDTYAAREVARLTHIKEMHARGELAPRHVPYEMPPGARIVDVQRSRWEMWDEAGAVTDTGDIWSGQYCSYCPFQQVCAEGLEKGT